MEPRDWQEPTSDRGPGMQLGMPGVTPAVKWLLIANVAAFLLIDVVLGFGDLPRVAYDLLSALAIDPADWKGWFPFVPVWQLLTYGFLHAGLRHILGNLLFLYFLGTMLEGTIGTRRFTTFYLATVVVAGLLQLLTGLIAEAFGAHGAGLILGASGGVLGITCAMATLAPRTRIIFILFPITLKTLAWIYVAIDAFNVIDQIQGDGSNVASVAHLAGAAMGYAAVRSGWIWRDPIAGLARAQARRAEESAQDDRRRLDELLARIGRDGIGSLSAREKAFLKKMSKRR